MARQEAARWRTPVEVHVGRTPEIIELSDCCIAVSGSVSLELMCRRKPTVIVYRLNAARPEDRPAVHEGPYITLVNLLAKEEVYPEFLTDRDPSKGVAAAVTGFLTDPDRREYVTGRLDELCSRSPGRGRVRRPPGSSWIWPASPSRS